MTDSFGVKHSIVIRNVSENGVGATIQDVPPLNGTSVIIFVPGGEAMNGTVRWIDGSAFGVELENPIELQALTEAMQRKQQTANSQDQWEVRRLHQVNSGHLDPAKVRKI